MIIHKIIRSEYGSPYLCNQAVRPKDFRKCSYQWKNVTCKNCLKQKPTTSDEAKLKRKLNDRIWKILHPEAHNLHCRKCYQKRKVRKRETDKAHRDRIRTYYNLQVKMKRRTGVWVPLPVVREKGIQYFEKLLEENENGKSKRFNNN